MAAAREYRVKTQDTDGTSVRYFATLAAAVKRFEEMSGWTAAQALEERYWRAKDEGRKVPTMDQMIHLSAVSKFGAVVVFDAIGNDAKSKAWAAAAEALNDAAGDWCVVCKVPVYDNRDGLAGSRTSIQAGPFATKEKADAALTAWFNAMFGPDGDGPDPDLQVYVARKSEGLRPPAAEASQDMWEDIAF